MKVTIKVSAPDQPESNRRFAAYWNKQLKSWLAGIAAVVAARRPWPDAGMPQEMQRAFMARESPERPVTVSEAVLIKASIDRVWELIHAPQTLSGQPNQPLYGGYVPGTPVGQVGEMQYQVHMHENDGVLLYGTVGMVRALDPGRSALFEGVEPGPDYFQTYHRLTPTSDGTRLELQALLTAQTVTADGTEPTTRSLQDSANAYKTVECSSQPLRASRSEGGSQAGQIVEDGRPRSTAHLD